MIANVFLSPITKGKSGKEGISPTEFQGQGSEAPRWTNIQKFNLSGEIYGEPPDADRVKFFYILQGEGKLTTGGSPTLRQGSTSFSKTENFCN